MDDSCHNFWLICESFSLRSRSWKSDSWKTTFLLGSLLFYFSGAMPNFKTIDAGTCGVMLRSLVTLLSWPGRWPSTVLRRLLGDDRGCIDECQNSKWLVMIEPMTINDETTSYKFNQCKPSVTILLQSMAMQMSNVMNISFFDLRMFWGMFDSHLL